MRPHHHRLGTGTPRVPPHVTRPPHTDTPSALRRGRTIGWIEHALAPLRDSHPHLDLHRLAITIRSATGIESFVWLVDVAALPRPEAAEILRTTAQALLTQALDAK
ncbi:hypothetical protein [Nocardia niigatensis]